MNLIEFGRSAHAEMDAIVTAARNGVAIGGTTLYCTTFPCHECAKLIVDSGIKKVVYIEPYPKSLALQLHKDAITTESTTSGKRKVVFEPFAGVGPGRYREFFSLTTTTGTRLERKDKRGIKTKWEAREAKPRLALLPTSYLDRELIAMRYSGRKRTQVG
jgi:deoxycytidylate deaminase